MKQILKYTFLDILRSRWTIIYVGFYLITTIVLFRLTPDLDKVIVSLMNLVLILGPLIATMFGTMYYYNSREFIELLLAQPVKRTNIILGLYGGLGISLSLSALLGIGIPFLFYGILVSPQISNFIILIVVGIFLSFVFSGLAFSIALRNENRIRGFSLAIVLWIIFAVLYDGLLLISLLLFKDYPLEKFALGASFLNPIDLSRILLLLKLDISAIMGYTGAVFKKFLGHLPGMLAVGTVMVLWTGIPFMLIKRMAAKKDY